MKIKDYRLFLENKQSKSDIDCICKRFNIKKYTINDDGTVDVDGDVNLIWSRRYVSYYKDKLTKLPLKFGKVSGDFLCTHHELKTLEGSPKWVGGDFACSFNKLTTLEGGPEVVLGKYYCNDNHLVNFKGFPEDYETIDWDRLFIYSNPVSMLLIKIPENKFDKFIYWCNELNVIDDNGNVNEEWMEEVYHKIGLEYK